MGLGTCLQSVRRWWKQTPRSRSLRRRPLFVEMLEDRTLPTVLFAPQLGTETLLQDKGQRINNPHVYPVLWGANWTGTQLGNGSTDVSINYGLFNSHYLDGLSQYGVTLTASYFDSAFVIDSNPKYAPTANFADSTMTNEIENLISNHVLPDPAQTPGMVVDMITDPTITQPKNEFGYNNAKFNGSTLRYAYIWNGTTAFTGSGNLSQQDACSWVFSHEIAEAITDPGGQGYKVKPGNSYIGGNGNQIGDFEGNLYQYRLILGELVQPYWSAGNATYPSGWLITDGNTQTVNVTPNWTNANQASESFNGNYNVTLNGGQFGNLNDAIRVSDQILAAGGAQIAKVTVNGEEFFFDDSIINQLTITIAPFEGSNSVQVDSSPFPGASPQSIPNIVVNATATSTVTLGPGPIPLTSKVSITDAGTINLGAGNADQIFGAVSIHCPNVQPYLIVDLTTGGSATLDVQPGNVRVEGNQAITFDAGRLASLTIDGGTARQTFVLGNDSSLDQLPFSISVAGQGSSDDLIVDGSHSADTAYTIRNNQVTAYETLAVFFQRRIHVIRAQTNAISYSGLAEITVVGEENSGDSFLVQSTAATTLVQLDGGSGTNQFTIGDPNHSLDADLGPITVNGQGAGDVLTVDDSGTKTGGANVARASVGITVTGALKYGQPQGAISRRATYVVDVGRFALKRTYTATVAYWDVSSIHMVGSALSTSFLVQSTAPSTPVTITAGTGSNTFQVGDANNPLDLLQAPVYLTGNGSSSALVLDDTAAPTRQRYEIFTDHLERFNYPAETSSSASVHYAGLTGITLDTGTGGDAASNNVFVYGSAANVPVAVYSRPGVADEYIAATFGSGATPFLAPVAFHGADYYAYGVYYDYFASTSQIYTLSADPTVATRQLVQQTGESMVSYDGVSEVILYSSQAGSNAIDVQGVAQGVLLNMGLGNADVVTVGSQAPNLGGSLATINGSILVNDGGSNHATLIVDDSGDPQARNATLTAPPPNDPYDPYTSLNGLAAGTIGWVLGAGSVINVRGGSGGTTWDVQSTPAGPPITLTAGTGNNTFLIGDATHSLDGLLGSVTLIGNGTNSSLVLNDSATTTVQNDDIYTDHFSRSNATGFSCAAVNYTALTGITFFVGGSVTAASGVAVMGSAANVPITVYGHAGTQTQLSASTLGLNGQVAFLAPVVFHGQDYYDFGAYDDYFDPAATTYTLSTDPALATRELVQQPGSVPVGFDGVTALILYARAAGGNQINVQSVAQGVGIHVAAGNSDVVTLGSLAPQLGGTLANFHAPVDVTDEGSTNFASLIIDDSGDTQPRSVTIDPPLGGPYHPETTLTGLTPAPTYLNWVLGDGSPVTILGGSGGNAFVIHGALPNVALTINGGSGNDLLIAGQTTASLIGGGGNDILIGGTTDYDYNAAAINAIMAELALATDATFASIANALETGANGLPALNANSVHANGLANQLTGGPNSDWFFANALDQALDLTNEDVFTMIQ